MTTIRIADLAHRARHGHPREPVALHWGTGTSTLCRRCLRIAVLWDARHDTLAAGRRIGTGGGF